MFPTFMAVSMGLSFHNSIAVIQGFMGKNQVSSELPSLALFIKKNLLLTNLILAANGIGN